MGEISVTIESLKQVKSALSEFQTQVDDVTAHASNHGETVINEIKDSLKKITISGKSAMKIFHCDSIRSFRPTTLFCAIVMFSKL